MPAKVILTVNKGELSGKTFTYDSKESLILGRQGDCSIVLPETTISRYHCLIDIAPPSVVVRDFGSLNGSYLNGEKIGQRDAGLSAEEARKREFRQEFPLKPGDSLGLGKDCTLRLEVILPQYCVDCFCEIENLSHTNLENMPICVECHDKRVEEKKAAEAAAKAAELKRKEAEEKRRKKELENKHKAEQEAAQKRAVGRHLLHSS